MHASVHVCMYACMYECVHTRMYASVHVCMCVYVCTYACIYMRVCVYFCVPRCVFHSQIVLVSATLPADVLDMTAKFMSDPVRILIKRDEVHPTRYVVVICCGCDFGTASDARVLPCGEM